MAAPLLAAATLPVTADPVHAAPVSLHAAPVSVQPSAISLQPAPACLHAAPAAVQPAPVSLHAAPAAVHSSAVSLQPAPVYLHAAPASPQPAPVALRPAPVSLHAASASVQPALASLHAAPAAVHSSAVSLQPAPVYLHAAPASVQPAPVSLHAAAVSPPPAPVGLQPAPVAPQPITVSLRIVAAPVHAAAAPLRVAAAPLVEPSPPALSLRAGLVWWPADPAEAARALGDELSVCLTERIGEVAPEIAVVSQRAVRDALFPLLEPATQPGTLDAFQKLLAREDVRARLAGRGLRYLVAFAGRTDRSAPGGQILCGAGYGGGGCLGFAWQDETTQLEAALWPLDDATPVQREQARSEGTSLWPAFALPIPIPARTRAAACRDLGTRIATAIREAETARGNRR